MERLDIASDHKKNQEIPSNVEAEQHLLGSVLVNNDIIDEIANIINSEKFYDPIHIKIYEVIESLNNKGMIANPITLKNYFEKNQGLDDVGGVEYLVRLTRFSSSVKQAIDYAKIVHENYVKRELIQISHQIKTDSINPEDDKSSDLIIEDAEKLLFDLAERGSFSQSFMKFNLALDQSINMAEQAMKMGYSPKKMEHKSAYALKPLPPVEKNPGIHKLAKSVRNNMGKQ